LEFDIAIKNFGQTPGYSAIIEISIGIDAYPPIEAKSY